MCISGNFKKFRRARQRVVWRCLADIFIGRADVILLFFLNHHHDLHHQRHEAHILTRPSQNYIGRSETYFKVGLIVSQLEIYGTGRKARN